MFHLDVSDFLAFPHYRRNTVSQDLGWWCCVKHLLFTPLGIGSKGPLELNPPYFWLPLPMHLMIRIYFLLTIVRHRLSSPVLI